MSLIRLIAVLGVALILTACATVAPPPPKPLTILVSIDGFRTDYLDRGLTPTLSALADGGARGTMRPSFPTKTFPNHYTLVTGLRPDRHGVVDNNMRAPDIPGVTFKMANHDAVVDARWWNEGTPIWVSAERAGIRTGTMFWPGSEAAIQGVRPSYWRPYDEDMTAEARVDQVLAWLDLPANERPRFATLYFDAVDTEGHHFGPDSAEVNAAIAVTDAALGRLVAGLKARRLDANLVVVADHGMAATSPDRRVWTDELFSEAQATTLTSNAILTVYPKPGHEAEMDGILVRPHPHMQCWRRGELPARFHYGKNPRAPPIFCLLETGWEATTHAWVAKATRIDRGNHGYDPAAPEMAAVFVANGPSFRPGVRPPVFDNVDVYPLLARLIGVRAEPGDGDLREIQSTLVR